MEISTEERLENGINHQPDRYLAFRDENGKLVEVHDLDSGRLWLKVYDKKKKEEGWAWID